MRWKGLTGRLLLSVLPLLVKFALRQVKLRGSEVFLRKVMFAFGERLIPIPPPKKSLPHAEAGEDFVNHRFADGLTGDFAYHGDGLLQIGYDDVGGQGQILLCP